MKETLEKISEEFAKKIKEDYGSKDVFTKTWNETMTLVRYHNQRDYTCISIEGAQTFYYFTQQLYLIWITNLIMLQ